MKRSSPGVAYELRYSWGKLACGRIKPIGGVVQKVSGHHDINISILSLSLYIYIYTYIHIYIYILKIRHFFLSELYFSFFQSSKVWKKPKYNSLKNKCLIFDIHIYWHFCTWHKSLYIYIERERGEPEIAWARIGFWQPLLKNKAATITQSA